MLPKKMQLSKRYVLVSALMWMTGFLFLLASVSERRNLMYEMRRRAKTNVVLRPFDPEEPKFVLLLGYQRVGSTFIGAQFFQQNDDFIYFYEPLDAVYIKLYGVYPGWAVPNDLHFMWNGDYRNLPDEEIDEINNLIEQLLTCDYSDVMSEYLLHVYWNHPAKSPISYGECVAGVKDVYSCRERSKLFLKCPHEVGMDFLKKGFCYNELKNSRNNKSQVYEFVKYAECLKHYREVAVKKCVPDVERQCKYRNVRVMKTVRLKMETIENLMDKYPNLRIIHLMRDPKAVVLSRMKATWAAAASTFPKLKGARSLIHRANETLKALLQRKANKLAENAFSEEAVRYCRLVMMDLRKRREIEAKYPGSTYELLYEKVVRNPIDEINNVYKFLGEEVPQNILKWFNKTYAQNLAQSRGWEKQLTFKLGETIESYCSELYENVDFLDV